MQRWGKHPSGKVRWRCRICGKNAVRERNDHRNKKRWSLFVRWLTSKQSLEEVARQERVDIRTLARWFEPLWRSPLESAMPIARPRILVLDGTVLERGRLTLLVAADGDTGRPLLWKPVVRENAEEWIWFLSLLHDAGDPYAVVCDAQKGLLKALGTVFPSVLVQRCLTHVIRQSKAWLTQHPRTEAGRDLLNLVLLLSSIRTLRQKRQWLRNFQKWKRRYYRFLKERTTAVSGRSWYTHRTLRAVRSLLTNATPDLFRYTKDPSIPRTSNTVEGGVNARLKELIRCHRGTSLQRQLALCCCYLASRQKKTNS